MIMRKGKNMIENNEIITTIGNMKSEIKNIDWTKINLGKTRSNRSSNWAI